MSASERRELSVPRSPAVEKRAIFRGMATLFRSKKRSGQNLETTPRYGIKRVLTAERRVPNHRESRRARRGKNAPTVPQRCHYIRTDVISSEPQLIELTASRPSLRGGPSDTASWISVAEGSMWAPRGGPRGYRTGVRGQSVRLRVSPIPGQSGSGLDRVSARPSSRAISVR